jgi:hypothetical protein
MEMQDNYRPDSDLYIIYNVGTQFASIAPRTLHKFVSTPRRRLVSPIGQT